MMVEDDILKEFLAESRENLDALDREFVALESDPSARHRIATIFRAVHTIKGTSGFLGFHKLEALTHAGENVLSLLRDGRLALTPEMTTALLAMVDGVRAILSAVEQTQAEGAQDFTALATTLNALLPPELAPQRAPQPTGFVSFDDEAPAAPAPAAPAAAAAPTPHAASPAPAAPASEAMRPAAITGPAPALNTVAPHASPNTIEPPSDAHGTTSSESSVRVDVVLLDKLMNLVGELVLARNQILQLRAQTGDTAFAGTSQRLNLITTELQEGVMKTRMQPIGNVWNKFPRVVRDLARQCHKQVRLDMEGAETELDRTIIEAIKDPLTHVVRNAIDHGIESPDERAAKGKNPTGRLSLRAFHEGGRVNIVIADDGAGIDPERVRQTAIRKGVVTAERAARMSDREAVALVFAPGFSTAAQVTNLSGRGVGMDVVKTNIEKIGGNVEIESHPGQGMTLKIRIPLTLAIVPALIITDGGERYAIPQVSLVELVRVEGAAARANVEYIQGAPLYRLRGNLLPLVYLHRALGEPERAVPANDDERVLNIVVVQADEHQFGLVVDGVSDTEEIVVKPLGKEIKGVTLFAGATIMGDGRVALILDVMGLAQRAGVLTNARDRERASGRVASQSQADDKTTMLLFQVEGDGRIALPLSMVARLEEFPRERVERAGRRSVVQYRNEILPLIDVCQALHGEPTAVGDGPLQVVVYAEEGRSVGLVVQRILDIVHEPLVLKQRATAPGLLGAATIQGRVTDVLDVHGVIRSIDPTFFDRQSAA